ncbi:hypothetical protein DID74_02735, partial [Candidatus Marinamargulisbacteria bacterium SCGC AG-333-B06]
PVNYPKPVDNKQDIKQFYQHNSLEYLRQFSSNQSSGYLSLDKDGVFKKTEQDAGGNIWNLLKRVQDMSFGGDKVYDKNVLSSISEFSVRGDEINLQYEKLAESRPIIQSEEGNKLKKDPAGDYIQNTQNSDNPMEAFMSIISPIQLEVEKKLTGAMGKFGNNASIEGQPYAMYHTELFTAYRERMYFFQVAVNAAMAVYQAIAKSKLEEAKYWSRDMGIKHTVATTGVLSLLQQSLTAEFNQVTKGLDMMSKYHSQMIEQLNALTKVRMDVYESVYTVGLNCARTLAFMLIGKVANTVAIAQVARIKAGLLSPEPVTYQAAFLQESAGWGEYDYWMMGIFTAATYIVESVVETVQYALKGAMRKYRNSVVLIEDWNYGEGQRQYKGDDLYESSPYAKQSIEKERQKLGADRAPLVDYSPGTDDLFVAGAGSMNAIFQPYIDTISSAIYDVRQEYVDTDKSFKWANMGSPDNDNQNQFYEEDDTNKVARVGNNAQLQHSFIRNRGDGFVVQNGLALAAATQNSQYILMWIRIQLLFLRALMDVIEQAVANLVEVNKQDAYGRLDGNGFSIVENLLVFETKLLGDYKQDIGRIESDWNHNVGEDKELLHQYYALTTSTLQSVSSNLAWHWGWDSSSALAGLAETGLESQKSLMKYSGDYGGLYADYHNNDRHGRIENALLEFSENNPAEIRSLESTNNKNFEVESNLIELFFSDSKPSALPIEGDPEYQNLDSQLKAAMKMDYTVKQDGDVLSKFINNDDLEGYSAVRKMSEDFEYDMLDPLFIQTLHDKITNTSVMRILIMMVESSYYSVYQQEAQQVSGTASGTNMLQSVYQIVEGYNSTQTDLIADISTQWTSRITSQNTFEKDRVLSITEGAVYGLIAVSAFWSQYVAPKIDKKFGAATQQKTKGITSFIIGNEGYHIGKLIAGFISDLMLLLGTIKTLETLDKDFASQQESDNSYETKKKDELDKDEEERTYLSNDGSRGSSTHDSAAAHDEKNTNSSPNFSDTMTLTPRGKLVVNKASLRRAQSAIKKRMRMIKLLQEIKDKENEARLDMLTELTGIQATGAHKHLSKAIGALEKGELAKLDAIFSGAEAISKQINQALDNIKSQGAIIGVGMLTGIGQGLTNIAGGKKRGSGLLGALGKLLKALNLDSFSKRWGKAMKAFKSLSPLNKGLLIIPGLPIILVLALLWLVDLGLSSLGEVLKGMNERLKGLRKRLSMFNETIKSGLFGKDIQQARRDVSNAPRRTLPGKLLKGGQQFSGSMYNQYLKFALATLIVDSISKGNVSDSTGVDSESGRDGASDGEEEGDSGLVSDEGGEHAGFSGTSELENEATLADILMARVAIQQAILDEEIAGRKGMADDLKKRWDKNFGLKDREESREIGGLVNKVFTAKTKGDRDNILKELKPKLSSDEYYKIVEKLEKVDNQKRAFVTKIKEQYGTDAAKKMDELKESRINGRDYLKPSSVKQFIKELLWKVAILVSALTSPFGLVTGAVFVAEKF